MSSSCARSLLPVNMSMCLSFSMSSGSQDRLRHFKPHPRIGVIDVEQVWARADGDGRGHHQLFADRIDRRVGHLREELLEIVIRFRGLSDSTASGESLPMEPWLPDRSWPSRTGWILIFLRVAKGLLANRAVGLRFLCGSGSGKSSSRKRILSLKPNRDTVWRWRVLVSVLHHRRYGPSRCRPETSCLAASAIS